MSSSLTNESHDTTIYPDFVKAELKTCSIETGLKPGACEGPTPIDRSAWHTR